MNTSIRKKKLIKKANSLLDEAEKCIDIIISAKNKENIYAAERVLAKLDAMSDEELFLALETHKDGPINNAMLNTSSCED